MKKVCVFGVPEAAVEKQPAALVIKSQEAEVTAEELQNLVAQNMLDFNRLRGGVLFVDSFPTTFSGKTSRWEAKILFEQISQERN